MHPTLADVRGSMKFGVAAVLAAVVFACFAAWPELRYVWLLLLVLLAVSYIGIDRRHKAPEATSAFAARAELGDSEIVSEYFPDLEIHREHVVELLREVAASFDVPVGKLRPSDRFGHELLGGDGLDDDTLDLQIAMNVRAKRLGLSARIQQTPTVEAYVRYFVQRGPPV